MAPGALIGSFRAVQNMGMLVYDLAKWVCTWLNMSCLTLNSYSVITNPQAITHQAMILENTFCTKIAYKVCQISLCQLYFDCSTSHGLNDDGHLTT